MALAACTICHGFVVDPFAACLHCGTAPRPRRRLARALARVVLAASASVTLMACYGAMPEGPYDPCGYYGCDGAPRPDAIPPDAAPGDAGDAAPPDAGVPDAGPCDGGPVCECPTLPEVECEASDVCSPVYVGVNCTHPDGGPCQVGAPCICEAYVFSECIADGA